MGKMNYEDLDIFQLSYLLAMKIHNMTMELPKYELYEEGSQIRRSSKSIVTNIVEGFVKRRYKKDFIKYLLQAYASCEESKLHLRFIYDSGYIPNVIYEEFKEEYKTLSRKIHNFINSIKFSHVIGV